MSKRDTDQQEDLRRQELIEKLKRMARGSRASVPKRQMEFEPKGCEYPEENGYAGAFRRKERGVMKLAEALQERADVQKRIAQVNKRLRSNARVQEGEQPAESPEALLGELGELISRLEELITRINKTNSETLDGDDTLTALIARRDCMRMKIDIMRDFLEEASDLADRSTRSEIKVKSTVSVAEKRKELDALAQDLRKLDSRIQQKNWLTDLL